MAISVISKTNNSITVSCSYPAYFAGDSKPINLSSSCSITWSWSATSSTSSKQASKSISSIGITWYWTWSGSSWTADGWKHYATDSTIYSDSDGYSGSLSLAGVSPGSRPSGPSGRGTTVGQSSDSTTYTGTASYSGTATRTNYSWIPNGWSHDASSTINYNDGTYSGNLSLNSVSEGSRPSEPSSTPTSSSSTTSKTSSGTAYYGGTVFQPSSGANITSTTMYLNGNNVGSGGSSNNFSYTFSGLSPSTAYNLALHWFTGSTDVGSNTTSATTDATAAPPAPSAIPYVNASVSGYAPTNVNFSWPASSPVTSYSYTLRRNGSTVSNGTTNNTSISFSGQPAGTYELGVTPFNGVTAGSGNTGSTTVYAPVVPKSMAGYVVATISKEYAPAIVGFDWSTYNGDATGYNYSTSTGSSGTTTSKSFSVGLKPAGTYSITVTPYNSYGNGQAGTISYTLENPPPPTAPVITSRFEGGFNLSWGLLSGATNYQLNYKPSVNSVWTQLTTSSTVATLNLGTYGLTYDLRVRASFDNQATWGNWSSTNLGTTNPKTPSISGDYTNGTVTIYASGMIGNWDQVVVERRLASNNSTIDQGVITLNGGYYQWIIDPSVVKNYYFIAYSAITNPYLTSVGYSSNVNFNRPTNFQWTGGSKISGANIVVLVSDWIALQNKVNAFRQYKSLTTSSFSGVSQTSDISAIVYNQVRNSISAMSPPTPPPTQVVGLSQVTNFSDATDISAYHFNQLRDSLNSIQ